MKNIKEILKSVIHKNTINTDTTTSVGASSARSPSKAIPYKRITLITLPILLLIIAAIIIGITMTNAAGNTAAPETEQTFTEEGDGYYIWVRAVDHAGNKGPWSEAQRVWIDTGAPKITLKSNSNTTWAQTGSVTVALQDSKSGLAAGAKLKYGWSTSTSTAPSSYTDVTPSYTAGTTSEVTFTASASGLTGKYYLWVVPTTLADTAGNAQTATVKSTGTFYFDNNAPSAGTVTMKKGSSSGEAYTNNSWTNQSVYVAKNNGSDGSGESGHSSTTWTIAGTAESGTSKTLDPGSGVSKTYSIVVTTKDVAGNTATKTYTVNIDKKKPTLTVANKVNGTTYNGDWTAGPISTVLTFSDDKSGTNASSLQWKSDSSDWATMSNTSTTTKTDSWSSNRNGTGYYRIYDNAGNYNEVSFAVKIDTVSPTVTAKNASITMTEGERSDTFESLFNTSWGGITTGTISYTPTSYSNLGQLPVGTHTITCTMSKNNGTSKSASVTVNVESEVIEEEIVYGDVLGYMYEGHGQEDIYIIVPEGVEQLSISFAGGYGDEELVGETYIIGYPIGHSTGAEGRLDTALLYTDVEMPAGTWGQVIVGVTPGREYYFTCSNQFTSMFVYIQACSGGVVDANLDWTKLFSGGKTMNSGESYEQIIDVPEDYDTVYFRAWNQVQGGPYAWLKVLDNYGRTWFDVNVEEGNVNKYWNFYGDKPISVTPGERYMLNIQTMGNYGLEILVGGPTKNYEIRYAK